MNRKFTIGAATGALALVVAIPALAQLANAQSPDTPSSVSSSQTAQPDDGDPKDAPDTQPDPSKATHVGANGRHEELLTGDDASKATAAALAAVPGGTIERVETDADGDAYEAHMTNADGDHVTVKFDADFKVTNIEQGRGGPR